VIRLTRRYRFSASHRLDTPSLSAQENRALYGKCNHPYGHGHDYLLEVSVRGPVDEGGRAADLWALDRLVSGEVLEALDRTDLNRGALAHVVPTTENLAIEVRRRLSSKWAEAFPGAWPRLDRIRIDETKRNHFELPG
jgi:6-pyruvoyltetrahydropterin/6-carboxytetrahydropterin synthase